MLRYSFILLAIVLCSTVNVFCARIKDEYKALRPPSVPLVVYDPYISIWSPADNLYDVWTEHWAGGIMALAGMLNVDGQCYRFMGPPDMSNYACPTSVKQISLEVNATRTIYKFVVPGKVELTLLFFTPAFMTELDLLGLPITYVDFTVKNIDTYAHDVSLYYDNTAEVAVNVPSEEVSWSRYSDYALTFLKVGTTAQKFNGDKNADRINWGYWYVTVPEQEGVTTTVASDILSRQAFAKDQYLPSFDNNNPRRADDYWPVLAVRFALGSISPGTSINRFLCVSYDEVIAIEFFGTNFEQNWKHQYGSMEKLMLQVAGSSSFKQYLYTLSLLFDTRITEDIYTAVESNGPLAQLQYARLGGLAYRQVTGGIELVWNYVAKETWAFMKEISSDGDVSTIDVIFPAAPLLLYLNPELLRLIVVPLMVYANNETGPYGRPIDYNLPWAPHHLGVWPTCNLKPSEQEQMPIEETGNIFVLLAYLARNTQKGIVFLEDYYDLLFTWGDYLVSALPDPGDQLCTDDFMGPSPHNVNLAAKGNVGLAAFAQILDEAGLHQEALYYRAVAEDYTSYWLNNGYDFYEGTYKLYFNLEGTWSQKYNIYFDYVLGMHLYPETVMERELYFYIKNLYKYGFALDNRANFTKADWYIFYLLNLLMDYREMWCAAMGNDEQFNAILNAIYYFVNDTPQRVPFTDWYWTQDAVQRYFRARPVVGGIWAKVLLAYQSVEAKSNLHRKRIRSKFLAYE